MAAAVAVYPNLIDAVFYDGRADRGDSKSWLVFFATVGPAVVGPIVFGVRSGVRAAGREVFSIGGMLAALAASGLLATSYFFSVIGLGDQSGLGAGIAEIVDSSVFPVAYLGWLWLIGRSRRDPPDLPGVRAIAGIVAICAGLIVLGVSARLDQSYGSVIQELFASAGSRILVSCAPSRGDLTDAIVRGLAE